MSVGPTGCQAGQLVLVVDDDAGQRSSLVDLLVLAGYDVAVAGDGQEALELLRRGLDPCVIILDLAMPRMSGWTFLERLRGEERSAVPVLVTSADLRTRPPAGADACVEKPIDVGAFSAVVARLSASAGDRAR